MNKFNLLKTITTGLSAVLISAMLTAGVAHATPYTGTSTEATPVPTFNSYTPTPGNPLPAPAPSDGEPDFLQGRVPTPNNNPAADVTTPYTDPVNTSCYSGEVVQLRVYVHNNADQAYNNNGTGPSVAHGVKVQVAVPGTAATTLKPDATISASNAATVSDSVSINCSGQAVQLQYVPGSASQFSFATNQATPLSDSIVSSGVPISSMGVPGDVWGCWNERVLVVLSVKVVIPPTPPVKTPPVCDLLKVEGEGLVAKLDTVQYTANDATVTGISVNFGDGTVKTLQPSQFPYSYTYAKAGTYTVTATVLSNLGNVTSNNCEAMISPSTTPITPIVPITPTTPTTPTPTALVNTGPGSVIGIFAGTTLVAGIGHYLMKTRRLARSIK